MSAFKVIFYSEIDENIPYRSRVLYGSQLKVENQFILIQIINHYVCIKVPQINIKYITKSRSSKSTNPIFFSPLILQFLLVFCKLFDKSVIRSNQSSNDYVKLYIGYFSNRIPIWERIFTLENLTLFFFNQVHHVHGYQIVINVLT